MTRRHMPEDLSPESNQWTGGVPDVTFWGGTAVCLSSWAVTISAVTPAGATCTQKCATVTVLLVSAEYKERVRVKSAGSSRGTRRFIAVCTTDGQSRNHSEPLESNQLPYNLFL